MILHRYLTYTSESPENITPKKGLQPRLNPWSLVRQSRRVNLLELTKVLDFGIPSKPPKYTFIS